MRIRAAGWFLGREAGQKPGPQRAGRSAEIAEIFFGGEVRKYEESLRALWFAPRAQRSRLFSAVRKSTGYQDESGRMVFLGENRV